jgi:hypothetical protein
MRRHRKSERTGRLWRHVGKWSGQFVSGFPTVCVCVCVWERDTRSVCWQTAPSNCPLYIITAVVPVYREGVSSIFTPSYPPFRTKARWVWPASSAHQDFREEGHTAKLASVVTQLPQTAIVVMGTSLFYITGMNNVYFQSYFQTFLNLSNSLCAVNNLYNVKIDYDDGKKYIRCQRR